MEENTTPKSFSFSDLLQAGIGFAIGIVFLVIVFLLFKLFSSHPSTAKNTMTSYQPTIMTSPEPSFSFDISNCSFTKTGNPLLERVSNIKDTIVGIFTGTITTLESRGSMFNITIVSDDASQRHTFTIPDTTPVFDKTANKILPFTDIKINKKISATFNCKPGKFRITNIGIIR